VGGASFARSCEETTAISVLKNNEGAVSSRHEPRK